VSVLAAVSAGWIGIGVLITLAGVGVCWWMLTLARSDRVLNSIYKNNSHFRTTVHLKPEDPTRFRRGLQVGLGFAALWGIVGICVGIGLIVTKGF
jgi:hypothetical protein